MWEELLSSEKLKGFSALTGEGVSGVGLVKYFLVTHAMELNKGLRRDLSSHSFQFCFCLSFCPFVQINFLHLLLKCLQQS